MSKSPSKKTNFIKNEPSSARLRDTQLPLNEDHKFMYYKSEVIRF